MFGGHNQKNNISLFLGWNSTILFLSFSSHPLKLKDNENKILYQNLIVKNAKNRSLYRKKNIKNKNILYK